MAEALGGRSNPLAPGVQGQQIGVDGGGDLTRNAWATAGRGNYWSDYAGYDADADQIGETPYASTSLFGGQIAAQWGYQRLFLLAVGLTLVGTVISLVMRRSPALVASREQGSAG